jgi:solute:Na+ symporter, SSS family
MSWIDWVIVAVIIGGLNLVAVLCRKYIKSVADFLVAGRGVGKFLGMTASEASMVGAITIVAQMQNSFTAGPKFWWYQLQFLIVGLVLALTGWGVYRMRQTRCLTIPELLERRYSRKFRIYCGFLCFLAGIINMGIFPIVGGRFFLYFCGLPHQFELLGMTLPVLPLIAGFFVVVSVMFCFLGGQVTIVITDFIQGAIMMLMYIVVGVVVYRIVNWDHVAQAIMMQEKPLDFVAPFSTFKSGEFDTTIFMMAVFLLFYGVLSWVPSANRGQAAVDAREAKLMVMLGNIRIGVGFVLLAFVPVACFAFMNLPEFADKAAVITEQLESITNAKVQSQMVVPLFLRMILPVGLMGVMTAGVLSAFISTHDTYFLTWASVLINDVVVPLRKKPLSTRSHLLAIKLAVVGVAVFVFTFSFLYKETEFIMMFQMASAYIFAGGAGAVILGALYWRKGTVAGAWAAMTTGLWVCVAGMLLRQQYIWNSIPFLRNRWDEFPINGYAVAFYAAAFSFIVMVIVSLCTGKKRRFDLDKLLNRGETGTSKEEGSRNRARYLGYITWGVLIVAIPTVITAVIVTYTHGISALTWIKFWKVYSFVLFGSSVPVSIVFITGGIFDIRRLFKRLKSEQVDVRDDGFIYQGEDAAEAVGEKRVRVRS